MNEPAVNGPAVNGPAVNDTVQNDRTKVATAESPATRPLDPRVVALALAGIRSDSERQPETYLRDTVVPHGGE